MGIFRALKRVVTDEVIEKLESPANGGQTTMSLRLKRDRSSGEHYVVLAGVSAGNYQYFEFDGGEFDGFARAVKQMQALLRKAKAGPPVGAVFS
jgi:hypothetical protein